ncbi:recombinase family protein [Vibrio astriarenae]
MKPLKSNQGSFILIIRAYLRASTVEQDASRARDSLEEFSNEHNVSIATFYTENVSGTKEDRPELERLIQDSKKGDILLIEKMDRLTRLPYRQWETLKSRITAKGISIVVADQPMTYQALQGKQEALSAIQQALTAFMLDLGAAMARDDYETRRKRQEQGIEKAKKEGKYKGRRVNNDLHEKIRSLLTRGVSYSEIQSVLCCSRSTIARVSKSLSPPINPE